MKSTLSKNLYPTLGLVTMVFVAHCSIDLALDVASEKNIVQSRFQHRLRVNSKNLFPVIDLNGA